MSDPVRVAVSHVATAEKNGDAAQIAAARRELAEAKIARLIREVVDNTPPPALPPPPPPPSVRLDRAQRERLAALLLTGGGA